MDIRTVSELPGHSSITTPQIYSQLSAEHRKAAAAKLSSSAGAKDRSVLRLANPVEK